MIVEGGGWVGAIALLLGYFLVSRRHVRPDSALYQGLNLVGSILLLINTLANRAYPSAFVNLIWLGIAGVGMVEARKAAEKRKV